MAPIKRTIKRTIYIVRLPRSFVVKNHLKESLQMLPKQSPESALLHQPTPPLSLSLLSFQEQILVMQTTLPRNPQTAQEMLTPA